MEAAPLTQAHTHARNAFSETKKANPIAASEEHDLAAGEFASAAKSTGDPEALRILRLLEQHHTKLAEILKVKPDSQALSSPTVSTQLPGAISEETVESVPRTIESSPRHLSHHVPILNRESSSSIATNLASARGIPTNRQRRGNQSPAQISTQTAEGRLTKPSRREQIQAARNGSGERRSSLEPSRARPANPAVSLSGSEHVAPPPITTANSEDAFARFYSTFNSIRHTLSAPLAFAGLPLSPPLEAPSTPTQPEKPPAKKAPQPQRTDPTTSPDINRLFSRAALRAIRDEHGHPASDSFYVVPASGGTMSYANMLNNARHPSNLTDSTEEFVDARETPQPASPTRSRRSGDKPATIAGIELDPKRKVPPRPGQTYEELFVENGMLKGVTIDLADRLRAFELGAQKSSLALHASMRQLTSPSASGIATPGRGGIPPLPGEGAAMKVLGERVRELEEQVKGLSKENKRLGRENEKLMGVVKRYREKWEALKEGARERIGKGEGEGGSGRTRAAE